MSSVLIIDDSRLARGAVENLGHTTGEAFANEWLAGAPPVPPAHAVGACAVIDKALNAKQITTVVAEVLHGGISWS